MNFEIMDLHHIVPQCIHGRHIKKLMANLDIKVMFRCELFVLGEDFKNEHIKIFDVLDKKVH